MNCINKNNKEFKSLLKTTGLSDMTLAAKIGSWQAKNNTDAYPTFNEVLGVSPGTFITYNQNSELSDFGTDIDFGRYVQETGDTSVKGFAEYQSNRELPSTRRLVKNPDITLGIDLLSNEGKGDLPTVDLNPIHDQEVKERYFGNKNYDNVTSFDIIDSFKTLEPENTSDSTLKLLSRLSKVKELNIPIKFIDAEALGDSNAYWDSSDNTIYTSKEFLRNSDGETVLRTLLHELVHSKVASALLEPSTPEELELQSLVREFIRDFSSLSKHYGFTNEMEFVAEFYSNPEFKNEVHRLYSEKESVRTLFDKIIDAIRRLFNMAKPNKLDKLMEAIVFNVEISPYRELQGEYGIFRLKNETIKNLVGYRNKIEHVGRSVLDNSERHKKLLNRYKSEEGREKTIEEIEQRIKAIELSDTFEKAEIIVAYVKELLGVAHANAQKTSTYLRRNANNLAELQTTVSRARNYTQLFEMLNTVKDLINDIDSEFYSRRGVFLDKRKGDIDPALTDSILELRPIIHQIENINNGIEDDINRTYKEAFAKLAKNPELFPVVEYNFVNMLIKEYNNDPSLKAKYPTQERYVNQMFKDRKDEYDKMLAEHALKVRENASFDIGWTDLNLSDIYNIPGMLVQVFSIITDKMEAEMKTVFRKFNSKFYKLYDEYSKFNNSLNQKEKFKNLLQLNENNDRYYIRGEYKQEVIEAWQKAKRAVTERIYGDNKAFEITSEEARTMEDLGVQSIFRKTGSYDVKEGDTINMRRTGDKISSNNSEVKKITTFGAYNTLTEEQKLNLANILGFSSMEDLFNSKVYHTNLSSHSKVHKNVYEYLQDKESGSLDAIQYVKLDRDSDFKLTEQPEILEYYEKYTNVEYIQVVKGNDIVKEPVYFVKDEYLDPEYSKLSKVEKDTLAEAHKILQYSSNAFNGRQNLIESIPGVQNFKAYKYPLLPESELEMRARGGFKKIATDRIQRLKLDKNDDINNASPRDFQGNIIHEEKVHYRNYIPSKDVSFSFFDVMMKEYQQAVVHKHRQMYKGEAMVVLETARTKNYLKKEKGGIARNSRNKYNDELSIPGTESNELKKLEGLFETSFHGIYSHADSYFLGYDANKIVGAVNGLAASVALTLNEASGVANILNGMAQLHLDAIGRLDFNMKNLAKAEGLYTKHMPDMLRDATKAFKTSYVNQILDKFNVLGGVSLAQQDYIKSYMVNKFGSSEMSNIYNEAGEHMMQSVLAMAILDGIKVMDKLGNYIDANGNIVDSKDKAMSLLDAIKIDEKTGLIEIDKNVKYTSHTLNTSIHSSSGVAQVGKLIKKRSFDLFGVYDTKRQGEVAKKWYGKALMMFKRFFISGAQHRYSGIRTVLKSPDELTETDRVFSVATKRYDEGYYTTFFRAAIKILKHHNLQYTKDYYNNLSPIEQANLRKATAEAVLTFVLLPAIGLLLAASFDDDDDKPYFLMYQVKRLSMELGQFYNPADLTKLTTNPIAGMRFVQNSFSLLGEILTPINLDPKNNEHVFDWFSDDIHGTNKMYKSIGKLTPGLTRTFVDYKDLYNASYW